MNHISTDIYK